MSNATDRTDIYTPPGNDIAHSRNRIWMGWIVIFIVVTLAFSNARSLERWAASQPPNWSTETVRLMAQLWSQRMQTAGFNTPRDILNGQFERLKTVTWPDVYGTPELTRSSPTLPTGRGSASIFYDQTIMGAHSRECAQLQCHRQSR